MEVRAIPLKERMGAKRQENIEIARRTAAQTRLAFPGQPDARAVFDARRDIHRQSALARHPARSDARRARTFNHLAPALTGQAGALKRKETLGMTDFAEAAAARTSLGLGAWLGARTGARLAGDRRRNADLRGLAGKRFLQRDFHIVAQIRAALASRAAAAAAAHAEQIVENVGEGGGEFGAKTVRRAHAVALLERGMAKTVIGRALVGILEDLVGLVDFLEPVFGLGIARISIRMVLHRVLAKGGLDLAFACGALD